MTGLASITGLDSLLVHTDVQHIATEAPPLTEEVFEWYAGKYRHELDRYLRARRMQRGARGTGRPTSAASRPRHKRVLARRTSARSWSRTRQYLKR